MPNALTAISLAVETSAPRAEILTLLMPLLVSFSIATATSQASYHPYGFIVVKLGQADSGKTVRLHMWPHGHRPRQVPDWPIHSHAYGMVSRVLCGELRNDMYEVVPVSSMEAQRLYRVVYEAERSILKPTDTFVTCTLLSRRTYRVGDEYRLAPTDYHATYVPEHALTATLVLTLPAGDQPANVVSSSQTNQPLVYVRRPDEPSRVFQAITDLRMMLEGGLGSRSSNSV